MKGETRIWMLELTVVGLLIFCWLDTMERWSFGDAPGDDAPWAPLLDNGAAFGG